MSETTSGKTVTVRTRGCDLSVLSTETVDQWRRLYNYTALQVWTWRGGEALVCCDYSANYGRGEYRVVVRTGGTKRGAVRVLWATCFKSAMDQMGISFRIQNRFPTKRERTSREIARDTLARAARKNGNMFRTLRANRTAIAIAA